MPSFRVVFVESKTWIIGLGLIILIVIPYLRRPQIFSGDEPHYLVVLSRMIQDKDTVLSHD
jgi:hypothetical protein